jgi:hypothetical protein
VAADIIHAINENKTINDIQSIIETKYDVDPVMFEKDFHEFIQQLKQYQLIENDKNN